MGKLSPFQVTDEVGCVAGQEVLTFFQRAFLSKRTPVCRFEEPRLDGRVHTIANAKRGLLLHARGDAVAEVARRERARALVVELPAVERVLLGVEALRVVAVRFVRLTHDVRAVLGLAPAQPAVGRRLGTILARATAVNGIVDGVVALAAGRALLAIEGARAVVHFGAVGAVATVADTQHAAAGIRAVGIDLATPVVGVLPEAFPVAAVGERTGALHVLAGGRRGCTGRGGSAAAAATRVRCAAAARRVATGTRAAARTTRRRRRGCPSAAGRNKKSNESGADEMSHDGILVFRVDCSQAHVPERSP